MFFFFCRLNFSNTLRNKEVQTWRITRTFLTVVYGVIVYTETTACQPTNPCKNGGTCFLSDFNNQNHVCVCATGYEPPNCEQPTGKLYFSRIKPTHE